MRPRPDPTGRDRQPWPAPEALGDALTLSRGAEIYRQGRPIRSVFLIERGLIAVTHGAPSGRECSVGLRAPGWLLGLASALSNDDHLATATTVTECALHPLSVAAVRELMRTRLDVATWLIDMLARESHEQLVGMALLGASTPRERLERLLAKLVTLGPTEAGLDHGDNSDRRPPRRLCRQRPPAWRLLHYGCVASAQRRVDGRCDAQPAESGRTGRDDPGWQDAHYPGDGEVETPVHIPRLLAIVAIGVGLAMGRAVESSMQDVGRRSPDQPPLAIEGQIIHVSTSMPVAGARVTATLGYGFNARAVAETTADERGRFRLSGLSPGTWFLAATLGGWVPVGGRVSATVGPQDPDAHVVLTLVPVSIVTGQVVDESNEPVASALVHLVTASWHSGATRLVPAYDSGAGPRSVYTDESGTFRIANLPPGSYYVVVVPRALSVVTPFQPAPVSPASGFAPTYYPGTSSAAAAEPLQVDGTEAHVTISLVPADVARVFGRVVTPAGAPVGQAAVELLSVSGTDVASVLPLNVATAADGSFVFDSVPVGTYVLHATHATTFQYASQPVSVGRKNPEITVALHNLPSVTGKLAFIGDAPSPQPDQLRVAFVPTDLVSNRVDLVSHPASVSVDDRFEIRGTTGVGLLSGAAPRPWVLKQVLAADGRDITTTPVDFGRGDVGGVSLVFTSQTATVSGHVEENQQPATRCRVAAFPSDRDRWQLPPQASSVMVPCGDDGTFTIPGLLAGDYCVVALQSPSLTDVFAIQSLLPDLARLAKVVRLQAGEHQTIPLTLVK